MASMMNFDVRGFRIVRRRLQNKLRRSSFNIKAGVREGGLMIQRNAQKRTPVVTGNLKASAYTMPVMSPVGPSVEVGYTSIYAAAVHKSENAGKLGYLNVEGQPLRYSNVGENRFLEKAVEAKKDDVLRIIMRRANLRTTI